MLPSFQLGTPDPVVKELMPAIGDRPAVRVTFNAQPSPLSLRAARHAVADVLRAGGEKVEERAGDAFTREIVRHNMLRWEGIFRGDEALQPTPDIEQRDDDGAVIATTPGTISAFLAEPRLMMAADREYVLPWSLLDAEKNGLSLSPNGTSAGAMPADGTASSPATQNEKADATTTKAGQRAPTTAKPRKRTRAKHSGS